MCAPLWLVTPRTMDPGGQIFGLHRHYQIFRLGPSFVIHSAKSFYLSSLFSPHISLHLLSSLSVTSQDVPHSSSSLRRVCQPIRPNRPSSFLCRVRQPNLPTHLSSSLRRVRQPDFPTHLSNSLRRVRQPIRLNHLSSSLLRVCQSTLPSRPSSSLQIAR